MAGGAAAGGATAGGAATGGVTAARAGPASREAIHAPAAHAHRLIAGDYARPTRGDGKRRRRQKSAEVAYRNSQR